MLRVHGVANEVFSAHAEVVPLLVGVKRAVNRILRARGGSSEGDFLGSAQIVYSPRTRR